MANAELRIDRPSAAERARGLDFAWRHIDQPQRDQQITRTLADWKGAVDPAAILLVARRGSEVVGGAWAQTQPGGTAMVSPPGVAEGEPASTADRLLEELLATLAGADVRLAQALLTTDCGDDFERLGRQRFEHVADLLYMVALASEFPDSPPAGDLEFEPYQESQQQRLALLVERTYEGTRDCPRMNGLRETTSVLAGYRAAGRFDPGRWFFLRHDGRDVGCLLLTEHPEHRQWELVYIGLVPEARGRSWGLEAVRRAQALAAEAHATCLLLAVDAANEPAVAMYAAAGFAAWDRRSVLVRLSAGRN
ncbi:MAG TPA: GNAT family N-acetyltransferase [Pirellulales bacterium]|jgi:ribosomal protein S18 acetylase RimI-like enzyme|nr:GNAT family N-acetyltransferase [Pirellulales bacterium]